MQQCILAGGVAVGISMSVVHQPGDAMVIGFTAAIVSTVGHRYLKVLITNRMTILPMYTSEFLTVLYIPDSNATCISMPWHLCCSQYTWTPWSGGVARKSSSADQRLRWSHNVRMQNEYDRHCSTCHKSVTPCVLHFAGQSRSGLLYFTFRLSSSPWLTVCPWQSSQVSFPFQGPSHYHIIENKIRFLSVAKRV